MSDSVWPQRRQPTRLPCPWDSPGKKLEWVAISFSNAWKWKVKVKSLSCVLLFATPWTAAYQAPPSMDFPGKSTGVGCHRLLCFMSTTLLSSCAGVTYSDQWKMRKDHVINGEVLRGPFPSHFCADQGACVPITAHWGTIVKKDPLCPTLDE